MEKQNDEMTMGGPDKEQVRLMQECLEKAVKKARNQKNFLTEEDLKEIFSPVGLKEEQFPLVMEYLSSRKISVVSGQQMEQETLQEEEPLPEEERDLTQIYLSQLQGLKQYDEAARLKLCRDAIENKEGARDEIISAFLPDVVEIAKLYTDQGIPTEDLIGEGNIGLMMAVSILDCVEKPEDVEGHIARMVMDSMESALREEEDLKKLDDKTLRMLEKVSMKISELSGELRRPVTAAEVSAEYGIPMEEIETAIELTEGKIEGLSV